MLNVLLVEDDFDLAETVIAYLELEEINCDYASNGIAGLQLSQQNTYAVILLDLNMPGLDGLSLCQQVRSHGDATPILMLTARDQLTDKLDGFAAGTDDYLIKPFELEELAVRIQALAKRRSGQSQRLCYRDLEMNLGQHRVTRAAKEIKLSPTAWRILETLLRAAPDMVSRQELITTVWGEDGPDSDSLKVHLHHLRKAVDGPFANPLVQTITGYGFAIKAEDNSG
ncbi:response regulator transcription factor [Pelobacter seleniigenes]|uniref:response regulator transcription factor n=1 Tax=Pelobacter seleniigenes TaxID=407188 RepID=UPI0004A6FFF6|nr:response regulator transcription factor [Pelobacter seleniigenes]